MTRGRWAAPIALAVAIGAAAIALAVRQPEPNRPTLLILTSLPILFGEDFALDSEPSPLLAVIERDFTIVPIDVTDRASLAKGQLLMMAQPRAQTATNLVALDDWVQRGGRLLLFADPRLDWHSDQPLGDPARPPPMFADTGLLAHWGLRLDAPEGAAAVTGAIGGQRFASRSTGTLAGRCASAQAGLVARCTLGRGRAIIVADADLLDLGERPGNAAAIRALLDSLRS